MKKDDLEKKLVYDLTDLSRENTSISKQYKDPAHLNLAVHFKKGTAKRSFLIPMSGISAYFATADGMTSGTVKLFTAESLATMDDKDIVVTKDSVLARFAVSLAAADQRYVKMFDGSSINNGKPGQFIKTNNDGVIDPSFFTIDNTSEIVGLGRFEPSSHLIVTKDFGSSNILSYYKLYTDSDNDAFILTDTTRIEEFLEKYVSPEDIAKSVAGETTVNLAQLSKDYKVGVVTGLGSGEESDWVVLNKTDQDYSTLRVSTEPGADPIEGSTGIGNSFVIGVNNISAGDSNWINGYDNKAYQGKGNVITGLKNLSSSHISFISGIENSDRKGYGNVVIGRKNKLTYVHSSFLSGYANQYKNINHSLGLGHRLNVSSAIRSILLGNDYKLNFSKDSLLLTSNEGTSLNSVVRSVVLGEYIVNKGELSNSIVSFTGNKTDVSRVNNINSTIASLYKAGFNGKLEYSIISGVNLTDGELETTLNRNSILVGTSTRLQGLESSLGSASDSILAGLDSTIFSSAYSNISNTDLSLIISKGTERAVSTISGITSSFVIASGTSSIIEAESSMIGVIRSTVGASIVSTILGNDLEVGHANRSIIIGDGSTIDSKSSIITTIDTQGNYINSLVVGNGSYISSTDSLISATKSSLTELTKSSLVAVTDSVVPDIEYSLVSGSEVNANKISRSVVAGSLTSKGLITSSITSGTVSAEQSSDSLLIGTLSLGNVTNSLVMSSSLTSSTLSGVLVSGTNIELGESTSSYVLGTDITTAELKNSLIIGSNIKVRPGVKNSYLIGDDIILSDNSGDFSYLVGKGLVAGSDGAESKYYIGENSTLVARGKGRHQIYGMGYDNSISIDGGSTTHISLIGSNNRMYAGSDSSVTAVGTGLTSLDLSGISTSTTTYIGNYSADTSIIDTKLRTVFPYDSINSLSTIIASGESESRRSTSIITGRLKNKTPFTGIIGEMYAESYRSTKNGIAQVVSVFLDLSKPIKPLRLLTIENITDKVTTDGADVNISIGVLKEVTSRKRHNYVLADKIYNRPAITLGMSHDPELDKYDYLSQVGSSITSTVSYTREAVGIVTSGTVIVEEDGTCQVGGYACTFGSGIVGKAKDNNDWDLLVLDKFTIKVDGKVTNCVRLLLAQ